MEWSIVLLVCGTLFLLFLIDGAYILSINQNLRRAVDMAEHANQAKTRFLSTMSHDIRTPMNAVIGMTEIAKLHLDDAGYVRDCLDKVSASSSHLLTLVNDILDISKVESGRMTLDPLRRFPLGGGGEAERHGPPKRRHARRCPSPCVCRTSRRASSLPTRCVCVRC